MTIQALILDIDGVLTQPLAFARYLEQNHPDIAAATSEFFRGIFRECIVGKANLREVLPPYLAKWGWQGSLDDYINQWFETEKPVDDRLLAVVQTIRQSGIPCYAATNQEQYRLQYMRSEMGFDTYFDGVFGSAEIGYRKPAAEFYRAVMSQIGVLGEQILFWDDTPENVEGARRCGWQAELYTDFATFDSWLKQATQFKALLNQ